MNYPIYTLLLLVLPLLSFVVLGIWGRKFLQKIAGFVGLMVLGICTLCALLLAQHYFLHGEKLNDNFQSIIAFQQPWLVFSSSDLSIDMGLLLDPISVMMLVVITTVSLMVHIFSLGYMKGEERYATYFAFLSLFTFSMLGLVLSSNLFQMYIFWELVGVSSYLLIGFYYTRPAAVRAAKKAFIVTRFADLGLLIGILMLGVEGGSFDFLTLIGRLTDSQSQGFRALAGTSFLGLSALTWALALVFAGGAGKSAMFPLHIWLPDAMEGPTPVSALIHAATMVVAGVFLVARLFPVFHLNVAVMNLIAWTGAISALMAAVVACTQTDIKRILAYSTMSQIGYMMFALGVSGYEGSEGLGYTASMFHLFTHAFFKSLLFLGAGVLIHEIHSNEIKDMGGLKNYMPVTHFTFLIGCLAIAGVPPLSGFFSKEEILLAAWQGNKAIYAIGLITAGITAFYMFRLYYRIFWHRAPAYPHSLHGEKPIAIKLPLMLLAAASLGVGLIPFSQFVTADQRGFENHFHALFSLAPLMMVAAGIGIATSFYKNENSKPQQAVQRMGTLYQWLLHKFYIDELYLWFTRRILINRIGKTAADLDRRVVDGAVNALGAGTLQTAESIKGIQSGKIQEYLLVFFAGVVILSMIFVLMWLF